MTFYNSERKSTGNMEKIGNADCCLIDITSLFLKRCKILPLVRVEEEKIRKESPIILDKPVKFSVSLSVNYLVLLSDRGLKA